MATSRVEVVHVGSACRDIAPDDPRGWRLGGGVTYAALTTALICARGKREELGDDQRDNGGILMRMAVGGQHVAQGALGRGRAGFISRARSALT